MKYAKEKEDNKNMCEGNPYNKRRRICNNNRPFNMWSDCLKEWEGDVKNMQ